MEAKYMLDVEEAERTNIQKGFHWFDRKTKRFFGSSYSKTLYSKDGNLYYFWSKEDSGFIPPITKKYTLRTFNQESGEVSTIGEFCGYDSVREVNKEIKKLKDIIKKEVSK